MQAICKRVLGWMALILVVVVIAACIRNLINHVAYKRDHVTAGENAKPIKELIEKDPRFSQVKVHVSTATYSSAAVHVNGLVEHDSDVEVIRAVAEKGRYPKKQVELLFTVWADAETYRFIVAQQK